MFVIGSFNVDVTRDRDTGYVYGTGYVHEVIGTLGMCMK